MQNPEIEKLMAKHAELVCKSQEMRRMIQEKIATMAPHKDKT